MRIRSAVFTLPFSLFVLMFCLSDESTAQDTPFPAAWQGTWIGELQIYPGVEAKQTVQMSISIEPTDSTHIWRWVMDYGLDSSDVRNYLLIEKDAAAGKYVIDEQNSILLEANRFGNTLSSRFIVNNGLLLINYHFREDHLLFEVYYGAEDKRSQTGEEVEGVEKIEAMNVSTRQQAILKRKSGQTKK